MQAFLEDPVSVWHGDIIPSRNRLIYFIICEHEHKVIAKWLFECHEELNVLQSATISHSH